MPARTPEERVLVARIGAAAKWGRTADRTAATEPARAGLRAKYASEVEAEYPDAPPHVREQMVDDRMREHMLRMSLAAKQARRRAREQTAVAESAERELADLGEAG